MDSTTMIVILLMFILILSYILNRNSLSSRSKKGTKSAISETPNKSNIKSNNSKYEDLITTLSIIDEILDEKISLGRAGVTLDFAYFDQEIKILSMVSEGKLAIFGPSFSEEIKEIVNDAEFDLIKVEKASKYVKNEISKLQKLI